MLHIGISEEVTLEQINATASEQEGQELHDLIGGDGGSTWGGNKYPEVNLMGAAFNYLREDALMAHLVSLPWSHPDDVQLFIQGQHDDHFRIYQLAWGTWAGLNC